YPNGPADVNEFQRLGGVPALMKRLHAGNFLHTDVTPTFGRFEEQLLSPRLVDGKLDWQALGESSNTQVLAADDGYFQKTGGTKMLTGNIGRCVVKVSAVAEKYQVIEAPARVFHSQHDVEKAYQAGTLNEDCVVVVSYNGPAANGMPELHKLMPILGNLQKSGYQIALLTDGRLSGASGKIPAAIHVSPEALHGGAIGLIRDGDLIKLNCITGTVDNLTDVSERTLLAPDTETQQQTWGRDMFKNIRSTVSSAELGASFIF
ncbi:MAG: dihydroxy-acid dehydratase, partial [Psychromonas sp.]